MLSCVQVFDAGRNVWYTLPALTLPAKQDPYHGIAHFRSVVPMDSGYVYNLGGTAMSKDVPYAEAYTVCPTGTTGSDCVTGSRPICAVGYVM